MITFIKKQINDIKTLGIKELLKKILISLKLFFKIPIFLLALIPLSLIRLVRPLILIRIDKIPTSNFGDLVCFNALYYCKKKLNINQPKKKYIDLLYIDPKVRISNSYLLKIWKEKFNIFNSFILKPIDQLNKMIPGGSINSIEILSTNKENDLDNLFEKYQAISFTSE